MRATTAPRGSYTCPLCGQKMVLHHGEIIAPHFKHAKGHANCEFGDDPDLMSPWHIGWQEKFDDIEVPIKENGRTQFQERWPSLVSERLYFGEFSETIMQYLYLKVSSDPYELPLAVADSIGELAQLCGVSRHTIIRGLRSGTQYVRVPAEFTQEEQKDIAEPHPTHGKLCCIVNGEVVGVYKNAGEAARAIGKGSKNAAKAIRRCANGEGKTCYGYSWRLD